MKTKNKKTSYNIRIVDNGNGSWSLGFVFRLKMRPPGDEIKAEWVAGSQNKMRRLLTKGFIT